MWRIPFTSIFIIQVLAGSVSAEQADSVDSRRTQYVSSSGVVDRDAAVATVRAADCNVTKALQTVSSAQAAVAEPATKLNIFLAQTAAYKSPPRTIVGGAAKPGSSLNPSATGSGAPRQIKEAAKAIQTADNTIVKVNTLVSYAIDNSNKRGMSAFKRNVEVARDALASAVTILTENVNLSGTYRKDLSNRGVALDNEFYEVCSGRGFWRIVASTQTASNDTSEMWEGVDKGCDGIGAINSLEYVALLREELQSDQDDGSGCKDPKLTVDRMDRVEVQSSCPWEGKLMTLTMSAEQTADDKVKYQTLYVFPNGNRTSLDQLYQRCDE